MAEEPGWDDGGQGGLKTAPAGDGPIRPKGSSVQVKLRNSSIGGNVSLENVDIIDLDRLSMDAEDAWLYRLKETPKDSPNPCSWMRQEFECHDLGGQPRSLLNLLDQASKRKVCRHLEYPDPKMNLVPSGSPEPNSTCLDNRLVTKSNNVLDFPKSNESPVGSAVDDSLMTNYANDPVLSRSGSSQTAPNIKGRYEIDSRTFTRPKKNKVNSKAIASTSDEPLSGSVPVGTSDEPNERSPNKTSFSVRHPLADYSNPEENYLKLNDLTDVQVIARMQEESLRSYCSSPLSYTPKTQRKGLSESSGRLSQGVSQGSLSCGSDVSIPNLSRDGPALIVKSTRSLSSASSDSSASRSESLTNVIPADIISARDFANAHPRSLPNLMKAAKFGPPRSLPSDSRLYSSSGQKPLSVPGRPKSKDDSRSEKTVLNAESKATNSSGVMVDSDQTSTRLKAPTAAKSVSGIPKPGFTSKLKQPTKWKKSLTTPVQNDGSWKEGCF